MSRHFGIEADLRPLPGDADDNFLARCPGGKSYIFKLKRAGSASSELDFQCAALARLAHCPLNLPRVVPDRSGNPWTEVAWNGEQRLAFLLTYCPGQLLCNIEQRSDRLLYSFGEVLARLDLALNGLRHPAMRPGHRWELTRAMDCAPWADAITGPVRAIAASHFQYFESHLASQLNILPHGVIHNDANDHNVLVNATTNGDLRVDGLFDFGDMAWQPLICESAIALAYLILDQPEPLHTCEQFLRGYTAHFPLAGVEVAALWPLIQLRLSVSVAISSHRHQLEPDNDYLQVSQAPAMRTLTLCQSLDEEEVILRLKRACQVN